LIPKDCERGGSEDDHEGHSQKINRYDPEGGEKFGANVLRQVTYYLGLGKKKKRRENSRRRAIIDVVGDG